MLVKKSINILGIDPGFANIGLAHIRVTPCENTKVELIRIGVINSKSGDKSVKDDLQRLNGIVQVLARWFEEVEPDVYCSELIPNIRNLKVMGQIRLVWGAYFALGIVHGADFEYITSKEVKVSVCEDGKASKKDMVEGVKGKFPDFSWPKGTKYYHAADAVGVCLGAIIKPSISNRVEGELIW